MPPVKLEIIQPTHNLVITPAEYPVGGAGLLVPLQGRVISTETPPLFYRWYSSLNPAPNKDQVALNWNDNQTAPQVRGMTANLGVGTHIITLVAKDRVSDEPAEVAKIVYAGMAGGPADAEHPCIVHVLLAQLPADQATALSKAGATLKAIAPFKWSDDDYKPINKIVYSWRFEPRGNPPNRTTVSFQPPTLGFVQKNTQGNPAPLVQYQGTLPAVLSLGDYTLVLRVAYDGTPSRVHEASLHVTIGA
ncbi:MAG TPA: hypothetical protein VGD69_13820 [Herpetosiphonaceae bacterium]